MFSRFDHADWITLEVNPGGGPGGTAPAPERRREFASEDAPAPERRRLVASEHTNPASDGPAPTSVVEAEADAASPAGLSCPNRVLLLSKFQLFFVLFNASARSEVSSARFSGANASRSAGFKSVSAVSGGTVEELIGSWGAYPSIIEGIGGIAGGGGGPRDGGKEVGRSGTVLSNGRVDVEE